MTRIKPLRSPRCAVIIPAHKNEFTELEYFILNNNAKYLTAWDVYFVSPQGITPQFNSYKTVHFNDKYFKNVGSYSSWLKTRSLYEAFNTYEYLLILQTDAILCNGDLERWLNLNIDYIGAPWHNSLIFNNSSIPNLPYGKVALNIGNGGLSLRNCNGFVNAIKRNQELISNLPYNEDAVFAIIALIDNDFKIGKHSDACNFSLELKARETFSLTKKLPFGFHALYKYDLKMWYELFPESPNIVNINSSEITINANEQNN